MAKVKNMETLALFEKIVSEKTKFKKYGNAKYNISEIKSGVHKGALLIIFPQTQNVTGWVKNFSAFARMYQDKKFFVHAGFKDLWNDIEINLYRDIITIFTKNQKNNESNMSENKIIITGYSQGGALAAIAHDKLSNLGFKVGSIVFGAPRVFLFAPKKRFINFHRIYVRGDIVTRVPFFPYRHVGNALGMGKRCFFSKIENHTISAYRKHLQEAQKKMQGGAK